MTLIDDLAQPVEPDLLKKPVKVDKTLDAIMSRIAPAHVNTPTLKVLIYGEPGVGKTTLAGSAPSPLVIDVERGSRSLLNIGNPVDVLEFRSIEQVEATIQYAKNGNTAFDKYETIVFDSITEMQARLIDQQLRILGAGAPVYKADWGVYGENTQRLRMLISAFRDIEKNLICTAHAKLEKDEQTGLNVVRPQLTPGLAKTVVGIFDIVGYLRINTKGERVLRVQPSKTVLAKSRLSLPDEITSPTWASLNKGQ
jgi:phage nucleotide-binding protein